MTQLQASRFQDFQTCRQSQGSSLQHQPCFLCLFDKQAGSKLLGLNAKAASLGGTRGTLDVDCLARACRSKLLSGDSSTWMWQPWLRGLARLQLWFNRRMFIGRLVWNTLKIGILVIRSNLELFTWHLHITWYHIMVWRINTSWLSITRRRPLVHFACEFSDSSCVHEVEQH